MTDKQYRLLRDVVIPKGTIFDSVDGVKREFVYGNIECTVEIGRNATAYFDVGSIDDVPDGWFEEYQLKGEK